MQGAEMFAVEKSFFMYQINLRYTQRITYYTGKDCLYGCGNLWYKNFLTYFTKPMNVQGPWDPNEDWRKG